MLLNVATPISFWPKACFNVAQGNALGTLHHATGIGQRPCSNPGRSTFATQTPIGAWRQMACKRVKFSALCRAERPAALVMGIQRLNHAGVPIHFRLN